MKTSEDFEHRARYLLDVIAREKMNVSIVKGRIVIEPKPESIKTMASELLEVFNDGWDHRSINL